MLLKYPDLFALLQSEGYDGVEASLHDLHRLDPTEGGSERVREELRKHNLKLILGLYSSWDDYEGKREGTNNGWMMRSGVMQMRCCAEVDLSYLFFLLLSSFLPYICLGEWEDKSVSAHVEQFEKQLEQAEFWRPLHANCHSG